MSKFVAIGILSACSFSLATPVQAQQTLFDANWGVINKIENRRMMREGQSNTTSGRQYPGEYRFECERRLGYWEWQKRSEQYPFNSPGDEHCTAMKESIKRQCRSLPNP
jgi:hypothetical protein